MSTPGPRRKGPMTSGGHVKAGLALVATVWLGGCQALYDGEVFYEQNLATMALIEAIAIAEETNADIAGQLYDAEAALYEACEPIQTVAVRKMDKRPVAMGLKLTAAMAAGDCDRRARAVRQLIWQVDPETAQAYFEN